jgi:hypothetical protein
MLGKLLSSLGGGGGRSSQALDGSAGIAI